MKDEIFQSHQELHIETSLRKFSLLFIFCHFVKIIANMKIKKDLPFLLLKIEILTTYFQS
jgi:hypothetical protein